ncbi:MAG: glycosyltransferase family 4 protein [Planctomycetota bacterium]
MSVAAPHQAIPTLPATAPAPASLAAADGRDRFVHVGLGWFHETPGGLERYQHGLCGELARQGVTTEAWVAGDPGVGPTPPYEVRAFADAEAPRSHKRAGLARGLAASLEQGGVVVTHHAAHAAMVRPLLGRKPHVVHFHGPWSLESRAAGESFIRAGLKKRIERRVYRSADRLVTLSDAFREVLVREYGVRRDRVRVVPGGIDAEAFDPGVDRAEARRRLGWEPDVPTLFTVRRLTPRMGLPTLIAAMPRLVRDYPRLRLYIGGRGSLREQLEAQIASLGLRDRVELMGFVSAEKLPMAYAAANLSVVPTRELEGFGLVCLESLSAGTPVLVTPVGGLPEVVRGLDPKLVMGGADADNLARGLGKALAHPESLPTAEACRDYVRRRFDWSVIAGRVAEVYREAAAVHAGRRA